MHEQRVELLQEAQVVWVDTHGKNVALVVGPVGHDIGGNCGPNDHANATGIEVEGVQMKATMPAVLDNLQSSTPQAKTMRLFPDV
jgi:hypothetical protein